MTKREAIDRINAVKSNKYTRKIIESVYSDFEDELKSKVAIAYKEGMKKAIEIQKG